MVRRTGPTNPVLRRLIREARITGKRENARVWLAVAERLERPRRQRVEVNLSQINRYTADGDVVVVPGKVLASGVLTHPVTVAAFKFSRSAAKKIHGAGGRAITIGQLLRENPRGRGVRLIA
jgi:large subunit ribosomal protein L18e